MPGFLSVRMVVPEARSPSGKAKVCKTFIGGSIPPRASKQSVLDNVFSPAKPDIPEFFVIPNKVAR
jgi:hypothetical protein